LRLADANDPHAEVFGSTRQREGHAPGWGADYRDLAIDRGGAVTVDHNPWVDLDTTDTSLLLDMDRDAVMAHNATAQPRHRFFLEMVPEPYMGRADAPVVLLAGNPRYREDDLPTHARSDVRGLLLASARQEDLQYPMVWLDPALADTTGAVWYRQRLRALCDAAGLRTVAENLAVYESLPYHSMDLKQPKVSIPSQAYTNHLALSAVREGRIVIWQRGPWQHLLATDLLSEPSVVRPRSLQSSYLSPKNLTEEVFARVVDAIRR
jgi:hypothetical protein